MVKDQLVSGVICEFNPFHNGHKYLLEQISRNFPGYIVCVMSGNYVQRGDCAIWDKWQRTETALANGADLVIELPLPFAAASAETFARGAVQILNGLGCADYLIFGSEAGQIDPLYQCAQVLLSPQFQRELRRHVNGPITFAAARREALSSFLGEKNAQLLTESNNILGVEYIKNLILSGSSIQPKTVRRHLVGHTGSCNGSYASASFLRSLMEEGKDISPYIPPAPLSIECPKAALLKNAERAVFYKLRRMTPAELLEVPDVSEGLEHKILRAAGTADSLESLYAAIKSKRYSHARIRRIILSAFLDIQRHHTDHVPYLRVLGMNPNGEKILRNGTNTLPFLCQARDVDGLDSFAQELFSLEAQADDSYALMSEAILPSGKDFTTRIIKYPSKHQF